MEKFHLMEDKQGIETVGNPCPASLHLPNSTELFLGNADLPAG
jgi:hypothetical protein